VDDTHARLMAAVAAMQRPDFPLQPQVPLERADDLGSFAYHSIYMGKSESDRELREGLAQVCVNLRLSLPGLPLM
jgi:hypothetical protein